MICPKCAMEIKEGSKFCSECGAVTKDLPAGNITENLSAPQVEEVGYAEEEAFFRVEKNGVQKANMTYDVVPKANRRPIAVPPKAMAEQVPISQQPKVQVPAKAPVEPEQGYRPTPPPVLSSPQPPSAPPRFQEVAVDHGVAAKKESPKRLMFLLGGVVVVLAAVVVVMALNLRNKSSAVKLERHNELSSTVQQEETVPTPTDVSKEESQGVDQEEEALKARVLKEEQLLKDKEDIPVTMNIYYASFIESINEENSDSLVFSTDANKEIVDYKIENPNKGYLFIANRITYDLNSIEVVEDETAGKKTATLNAKFDFTYRKKTETENDWVASENLQKCSFIYDDDTESWLVDNTEIDSTIELGDNIEVHNFEPA